MLKKRVEKQLDHDKFSDLDTISRKMYKDTEIGKAISGALWNMVGDYQN